MITALLLAVFAQASDLPPNVIIVVGDDIALSDVDGISTPRFDSLASQGVAFRRAHAHPLCSPTRRSILFGRWPGRHTRATCNPPSSRTPRHSEFSLPKLMKGAGNATGIFGKWHLGTNFIAQWEATPQFHGFDVWRAGLEANVANCGGVDYFEWKRVDDGLRSTSTDYHTTEVRDAFFDWWAVTPEPKFAYVAYQAAHGPFHIPPGKHPGRGGQFLSGLDRFELMVSSLDDMLGDMLAAVDLNRTYFIYLADNGTPAQVVRSNQSQGKVKGSTFRDGVVVPWVVAGPGIAPGVSNALIHSVDLLATIADLIDVRVPGHLNLDSRSFRGALLDPVGWHSPRRYVFLENDTPGFAHDRAVRTDRWKLRDVDGFEELYDLLIDPLESNPLDLTDPALHNTIHRLRGILRDPTAANPPVAVF